VEALRSQINASPTPVTDERSDAELVLLSLRDPASFTLLYRRYAVAVYRYCDRTLGNRDDAEEATQTVFLRAMSNLATCRNPTAFRSWLFAIAHNVIVNQRAARRPVAGLDAAEALPDRGKSPEEQAIAAVEHREVRQLLAQLPAEQRELVELRLEGLSDKEIAEVLGRSPGAIRTAQYRAVQRLRSLVSDAAGQGVTS
jgi:RNA polymerase sigma-70 factor (ECF subfamily)